MGENEGNRRGQRFVPGNLFPALWRAHVKTSREPANTPAGVTQSWPGICIGP